MEVEEKSLSGLMDEEIIKELEDLKDVKPGSEEYKNHVEPVAKLSSVRIDEYKAQADFEEKTESKEKDISLDEKKLAEEKKSRWFDRTFQAIGTIGSAGLLGFWVNKCLKFEETGCITSGVSRGFISKAVSNIFKI